MTPQEYRDKTLDYLYGLLGPDDAKAFEEAGRDDPALAAELERARRWQSLIGRAAKIEFPEVKFAPPAGLPVAAEAPERRPRRAWFAVAASLLVAAGLAVPPLWTHTQYRAERDELADLTARLVEAREARAAAERGRRERAAALRKEATGAARKLAEVQAEWRRKRAAAAAKPLRVQVVGPERAQPGARNRWLLSAVDKRNNAVKSRLSVVVRAEGGEVIDRASFDRPAGQVAYDLPLAAWRRLPPGIKLDMEVVAESERGTLRETVPLAPPAFVTHLATDKPMYRPGEVVRFRSVTLRRSDFRPPAARETYRFTVRAPSGRVLATFKSGVLIRDGEPVLGPDGGPLKGVGVGEFPLPPNGPGGVYRVGVERAAPGGARKLAERTFLVNKYVANALEKKLEFAGKSYGAGDTVLATAGAKRKTGEPLADTPVTVTVRVDGNVIEGVSAPAKTDAAGKVRVRFDLPAEIEKGDASLAVKFNAPGAKESIVRPVPLALSKLSVEFFPEGGELVAGVPCRVYFRVRTPAGKPADLIGKVVAGGEFVCEAETLTDADRPGVNQGLGVFTLTPEAGKRYELKIDRPANIEGTHALPPARRGGVALTAADGVVAPGDPIKLRVTSAGGDRPLLIGAYCRGVQLGVAEVKAKAGEPTEVTIDPAGDAGGVVRVTAFDRTGGRTKPVAERLIFREPSRRLKLTAEPALDTYTPGGRVEMRIKAEDEAGNAAAAILMVGVVNQNVVTLADDKTERRLPTHFLIGGEVENPEDLEHADFLLTDHPLAGDTLDLLLGTQGWRRFAEVRPEVMGRDRRVARLLDETRQLAEARETAGLAVAAVNLEYGERVAALRRELGEKNRAAAAASAKPDGAATLAEVRRLESERRRSESRADELDERRRGVSAWVLLAGGVGLLLAAGVAVIVAELRRGRGKTFAYAGAAAAVVVAAVAVAGFANLRPANAPKFATARDARRSEVALDDAVAMEAGKFKAGAKMAEPADGPVRRAAFPKPEAPPGARRLGAAPEAAAPKPVAPVLPGVKGPVKLGKQAGVRDPAMPPPPAAPGLAAGGEVAGKFDAAEGGPEGIARDRLFGARREAAGRGKKRYAPPPSSTVRVYAHPVAPADKAVRDDFTDAVFWHPVLVLPGEGEAEVTFGLSSLVTRYRVLVAGHTLDGRVGASARHFRAVKPLEADLKLPAEVNSNDRIEVPVVLDNASQDPRIVKLGLRADGLTGGKAADRVTLRPGQRLSNFYSFRPAADARKASLTVSAATADRPGGGDVLRRSLTVVPEGFPVFGSHSDLAEGVARFDVGLPDSWVKGTLKLKAELYPSTMADAQKGLEGMLREPHGCFEQTSSSNYPNVLILGYLKETDQAAPQVEARAMGLLDRGYKRLMSFECRGGGFEWFGRPPAHEALTAYGLMQFRDMQKVTDFVDPKMVARTQAFLLGRRDGDGGFTRNPRGLDSFGRAPKDTTDAYITWALTEGGPELDIKREVDHLAAAAGQSNDSYVVALAANALLNRGRREEAIGLLKKLAAGAAGDGHIAGAATSVTRSRGKSLDIETTSLAVLGWLKASRPDQFGKPLGAAVEWIGRQRGGYGGYGSTQSTVLALKALIAHAKQNKHPAEAGELRLYAGQKQIGAKEFTPKDTGAVTIDVADPASFLKAGKNALRVEVVGGRPYPFTVAWSAMALKPASADGCLVRLKTSLGKPRVALGGTVELNVELTSLSDNGTGMATAIVGLPAGLKLPEDMKVLKKLTEVPKDGTAPRLAYFELLGPRELVLYWRALAPRRVVNLRLPLIAEVPGEYRGPASRAYLYYDAESKHWNDPLSIRVTP